MHTDRAQILTDIKHALYQKSIDGQYTRHPWSVEANNIEQSIDVVGRQARGCFRVSF